MKLEQLKVNGIKEPIGYEMNEVTVSWKVVEANGTGSVRSIVEVSSFSDFSNIIYQIEEKELACEGTMIDISLEPRKIYYVRVTVEDETGDCASSTTKFETGKRNEGWKANWIGINGDDNCQPVFRKIFDLDEIEVGRLYISGLGLYEAYLNGKKIGEEYLTPYFNDYTENVQIQTYDISAYLEEHNVFEVYLGNGWYKGRFGMIGHCAFDQFCLIAELHIQLQNQTEQVIVTDDSWEYTNSCFINNGIYDGEIIDKTIKTSEWKKAILLDNPKVGKLCDRYSIPVVKKMEIPVKEVINTHNNEWVLDFGQNMAGWVVYSGSIKTGQTIHFAFGEVLQDGNFYNENYRSANGGFQYTSNGECQELIRPHFTYFGFRYVRVTGIEKIHPDDFKAWVLYSDLDDVGSFETNHEKLNRLYQNCVWGQRSNFVDIPTDCPQRDERLAWTGDAEIFAPTATYNMDTKAFYRKFMWMMRTAQNHHDGGVPSYVPEGVILCDATAGWGDAATIIPDTLYLFYQDQSILKEYYPMMIDWVDYVGIQIEKTSGKKYGLWTDGFQFGDWLALDGFSENEYKGSTPDVYMASMYYYNSLRIVAKAASILKDSQSEMYENLANQQKKVLLDEYFSPNGHLTVNTQTAYILALKFEVYRVRDLLIQDFIQQLRRDKYKIRGGFVGGPIICQVLAECGLIDLAYHYLMNEDYPGWFYQVNMGATTIWERWNSILPNGKINPTGMNSLNHYSYGSVCEFMYKYMAGIKPGEHGFKDAIIEPLINPKVKHVKASYDSISGKYEVEWKLILDGRIYIKVNVPFGCHATLNLPYSDRKILDLSSGVYEETYVPNKDLRCMFGPEAFLSDVFAFPESEQLVLSKIGMADMYRNPDNAFRQVYDLYELIPMGVDPQTISEVVGRLGKLKAW